PTVPVAPEKAAACPLSAGTTRAPACMPVPLLKPRSFCWLSTPGRGESASPARFARHSGHQMLLVAARTPRGCRAALVERPMREDAHDQLLLHSRAAVAEYARTLMAERRRRGRQAKRRGGPRLPWTRAPSGSLLDPEPPRDPSGVGLDPVQGAVVEHMFAWYIAPQQAVSFDEVAQRLSEAQMPTPQGGKRWHVASVRGILRSPPSTGVAYSGRSQSVPARQRQSALQPVGSGQSQQPAPMAAWMALPVPAIL